MLYLADGLDTISESQLAEITQLILGRTLSLTLYELGQISACNGPIASSAADMVVLDWAVLWKIGGGASPTITGNGINGITAYNVGVYLEAATVTDNADADVQAGLGTRLIDGVDNHIGIVSCTDASVLSYGALSCPEPEQPDQSAQ